MEGEGFHQIEGVNFQIEAPDIYFMKPGQLHYWQFTAIPKGFVLLFKDGFIDPLVDISIVHLINQHNTMTRLKLGADFDPLYIFESIFDAYQNSSEYSVDIIQGYLRTLFAKILQLSNAEKVAAPEPSSLYDLFRKMLISECPAYHKVIDFAALLNTSTQNLNAVCKRQTNKSAAELINEQLLLEAKRNILHTDKTINKIADYLHFNDASYFIKFFKKYTGDTPHQYRTKYLGSTLQ